VEESEENIINEWWEGSEPRVSGAFEKLRCVSQKNIKEKRKTAVSHEYLGPCAVINRAGCANLRANTREQLSENKRAERALCMRGFLRGSCTFVCLFVCFTG
jgi:hypothetical protein